MSDPQHKAAITKALNRFTTGDLVENGRNLLNTLGYRSERTLALESSTAEAFIAAYDLHGKLIRDRALTAEWSSIDLLFQLSGTDLTLTETTGLLFDPSRTQVDNTIIESYLFFALRLEGSNYNRTQLAQITREINKLFMMPAMLLFQHGETLTLSIINRRLHASDPSRDVLEKVTLIKDIDFKDPHRAHIDILFDLALEPLNQTHSVHNFVELHRAWEKTLDTEELNKKFYRELFTWFEWAVVEGKFPTDKNRSLDPEEHVIRLITRLLFVWFIKEKGLIADELFNEAQIAPLLKDYDRDSGDSYYRAVLQNLFFATLNTEIGKRGFSEGGNPRHRNFSLYRYKDQITDPDTLLTLFQQTPFINGGLFDCLDSEEATREGGYRIDCFSDVHYNKLRVPNRLFFDDDQGLIPLLQHYKFTVEENTPIEQEVALDPELLGKVFENLLAAYNPETGATARKQTGSYYTPRPIVDYMVEEALVAALAAQVSPTDGDTKFWAERLRYLFDYAKVFDDASEFFDSREADEVVRTISELKILDPAVGSGAFPMGVLHKLTLALRRLDPDNTRWAQLQKERAIQRAAEAFDTKDRQTRDEELKEISRIFENYSGDFGRKLYLIQNSIFGLDIQSIACQIAKLRFFISLAIEQEPDRTADNFGIKPLPNLETRFIAANTLIGLEGERTLTSPKAKDLEMELGDNRERHFHATTRPQKLACKRADKKLRRALATELKHIGMPADDANKVAAWDPYDQNASADWFDPEWMFGIVDGFDVVVGNPPYVRQEKIRHLKPALKNQYDCYTGTADLYVYFYERGFQMLRNNGVLTYISSNKYFRSAYGKKLRDFLARQSTLSQLIDFGDAPVFTSIAYPSIITTSKAHAQDNYLRALNWEPGPSIDEFGTIFQTKGFTMPQNALTSNSWQLTSPDALNLLEKLRSVGKPLSGYVKNQFYRGVTTGLNNAFVINQSTRDRLISEDLKSTELIKPWLRGKDVKRWQVNWTRLYVIFLRRGVEIEDYPVLKAYLSQFKKQLTPGIAGGRKEGNYQWYEIQDNTAYYPEFEKPKIVYPDIAVSPQFAYDESGAYGGNTMYIVPTKEMWLLGLLNSKAVFWFYTKTSTQIRGGFVRFIAQYVSQIPIPSIKPEQKVLIGKIVNQILATKRTNPDADVSELENEIDQIVYLLYDLTSEDIAIVEDV